MLNSNMTKHAIERFAQRGFALSDADLVIQIGTEVTGGYFVRDKDADQLAKQLRALLKRVEKLKGKRIVLSGGVVITGYRACSRMERHLLQSN